jgi:hypothetical protein
MKNQITFEQIDELIDLRLKSLGKEPIKFKQELKEINDPIINWLGIIWSRKLEGRFVEKPF